MDALARGWYALDVTGDLNEAHSWFEQAHRTSSVDGEKQLAAEAALGLGGLWLYERRGVDRRGRRGERDRD